MSFDLFVSLLVVCIINMIVLQENQHIVLCVPFSADSPTKMKQTIEKLYFLIKYSVNAYCWMIAIADFLLKTAEEVETSEHILSLNC